MTPSAVRRSAVLAIVLVIANTGGGKQMTEVHDARATGRESYV